MKSWDYNTLLNKFISIFHCGSPTLYPGPKTQVPDLFPQQEIALLRSECSQQKRGEHIYDR